MSDSISSEREGGDYERRWRYGNRAVMIRAVYSRTLDAATNGVVYHISEMAIIFIYT